MKAGSLAYQLVKSGTGLVDTGFVSSVSSKILQLRPASAILPIFLCPTREEELKGIISYIYQWEDCIRIIQESWLHFSFSKAKRLFLADIYWKLLILLIKGTYLIA